MSNHKNRLLTTIIIFLSAVTLFVLADIKLPVLDSNTDRYFSNTAKASAIAYTTTRGINAVVSVIKESEIELSPAGVGLSIAAGQILDPIDDMTERLSSVLVVSIVSIGIQKIGYEIGKVISFKIMALILILLLPIIWFNIKGGQYFLYLGVRVGFLLLLLRFLLPVSSMLNELLYDNILKADIEASIQQLTVVSENYEELSSYETREEEGFFSSITGSANRKAEQIKNAFNQIVDNVEGIVSSLLKLTTLYVALFIIQVLIIPLLMLWLIIRFINHPMLATFSKSLIK